nr:probable DNA mismatch repair protein Msh6 [Leptinotarsa decemlineata]
MPLLESFYATFDLVKTEKYGKIIPKTGVNEEFDVLETRLKELLKDSTDYINEMSVVLGCTVEYYETDIHPILLKVPEEHCHILTDDYDLICIIPGDQPARLYLTPFTKTLSEDVLRTEGKMDDMLLNLNSSWFREFSEKKQLFEAAIQSLATLDVLCSLADYARTCTNDLCIPDVRAFEGKAILAITNSYQPCGENIENFVPNDIKLGVEDKGRLKIIIGPEVSGKSTLLRQVGVTSILAHIGSLVPASCCVLTVMDRVCCRVGVYNESIKTLYPFVGEMGDICSVLTRSTERSLLLIDEIGKGSLPKDFVGIANVFIMKLLHSMCRVIVSTHCHAVALAHVENRNVGVANMDCVMALDENGIEQVTSFLYKLQELEM